MEKEVRRVGQAKTEYMIILILIGIALISIFGAVGGVATSILTNFEIPLRILSIAILVFTYFMIVKDLNRECKVKFDKFRD